MKNKVKAAFAVGLMAGLVRPDALPPMWITALLGIAFYECALCALRIHGQIQRDKRIAENVFYRKRDGEALENERFNPIREVS